MKEKHFMDFIFHEVLVFVLITRGIDEKKKNTAQRYLLELHLFWSLL